MSEEATKFINLGIVLNKQGEALMIRRVKEETGKDGAVLKWAFPGGKQKLTESRNDCVKREVLAETGYDIKPIKQISLRKHPQIDMFIAYHLCKLNTDEPVAKPIEPHEVAEIKWVKLSEIEKLVTTDLDPGVKKELGL
ncbi:MAG TPA: NUDIX hydrolase [Candidatus Paceibacterota bacterium]